MVQEHSQAQPLGEANRHQLHFASEYAKAN